MNALRDDVLPDTGLADQEYIEQRRRHLLHERLDPWRPTPGSGPPLITVRRGSGCQQRHSDHEHGAADQNRNTGPNRDLGVVDALATDERAIGAAEIAQPNPARRAHLQPRVPPRDGALIDADVDPVTAPDQEHTVERQGPRRPGAIGTDDQQMRFSRPIALRKAFGPVESVRRATAAHPFTHHGQYSSRALIVFHYHSLRTPSEVVRLTSRGGRACDE